MVYIVLVSYSKFSDISNFLQSVMNSENIALSLIIMDNLGDKELKHWASTFERASYYSEGNLGYGSAINFAVKKINLETNDQVIICNDDLQIKVNTFRLLLDGYKALKARCLNLGPVSPWFMRDTGEDQSTRYENIKNLGNDVLKVDFSPAAMWLLDYDLIKLVGGFLPEFFMYAEDKEYVFRAKALGFDLYTFRNIEVVHNFDYPPKSKPLRIEKIRNTFLADFLNNSGNSRNPHIHVVKALLVSLRDRDLSRFHNYVVGYFRFVKNIQSFRKIKQSHKGSVPFRYVS